MSLPPPPPRNSTLSTLSSPPQPAPPSSSSSSQSHPLPPPSDTLSRDFPETSTLSREDLQLLLEDPAYFDAWFHTQLPQARQLHEAVETRINENLELAQKSQELKPELEALRRETKDLFDEASDLKLRSHYLSEAQQSSYSRFSYNSQLSRLRAATTLQEHLSESLVQSLLDGHTGQEGGGGGELESWIKQYREVRGVWYKRNIGLEKWDQGKVVWET
ncbi:hypothetical protein JCM5353_007066 [Sporobolomyces roseus]